MILEEMTMCQVEQGLASGCRTVFIPFGSLEEHGSHLPLSTDTIQAYRAGRLASEKIPLFVAPPIHYGSCRSTNCHPGTVSISTATVKSLLKDLVRSFHRQGLKNVIALTGHAGGAHRMALQDAGEELLDEIPDLQIAVVTEYELVKSVGSGIIETVGDAHAGEIETSRIMHSHPELVQGISAEEYPSFPPFILVRDKRRHWPGGVWGNPLKATPEKGAILEAMVVDSIVSIVRMLEENSHA